MYRHLYACVYVCVCVCVCMHVSARALPGGQLPQMNDPGRLIHCTRGCTEHGGLSPVHSSTSTTHAGLTPSVVQPSSQIQRYLG